MFIIVAILIILFFLYYNSGNTANTPLASSQPVAGNMNYTESVNPQTSVITRQRRNSISVVTPNTRVDMTDQARRSAIQIPLAVTVSPRNTISSDVSNIKITPIHGLPRSVPVSSRRSIN
jgi:hypothetical protein